VASIRQKSLVVLCAKGVHTISVSRVVLCGGFANEEMRDVFMRGLCETVPNVDESPKRIARIS
jgi:hypothetical protein